MTIEKLITEYAGTSDTLQMEKVTKAISTFIEDNVSSNEKNKLIKRIYGIVGGGHFNEYFANHQLAEMYYIDKDGSKHYAPYWTEGEIRTVFESVKEKVTPYNLYDFIVVMNMVKSDQYLKLRKWFPDATEEEIFDKLIDEAIVWLDDNDNPFGNTKAWGYFNGITV